MHIPSLEYPVDDSTTDDRTDIIATTGPKSVVAEVVSVTVALIALIGTIIGIVIVMVICNIKRKAKKSRDGLHPDFILESRYHCSSRIKDHQELDVERCQELAGLAYGAV